MAILRNVVFALFAILMTCNLACNSGGENSASRDAETNDSAESAINTDYSKLKLVATIDGFHSPETIVYDQKRNAYYVSNMGAHPTDHDNDGFISKIDVEDFKVDHQFLVGTEDLPLNGPKGMTILNGQLVVVDVAEVGLFDLENRKQVRRKSLAKHGAVALNDVALNKDWLCLTDPKLLFDKELNSHQTGRSSLLFLDHHLDWARSVECPVDYQPNGVEWHTLSKEFVVVPLQGENLATTMPFRFDLIEPVGKKLDGIEVDGDGNLIVSSLQDRAIQFIEWPFKKNVKKNDRKTNHTTNLLTDLPYPGNFCFDQVNHRLVVPLIADHKVVIYEFRNN